MLWGDVLGVLAGASWGATTVVIRRSTLSEAAPTKTLLYQLSVGCVLLLAAAVAFGHERSDPPTPAYLGGGTGRDAGARLTRSFAATATATARG